MPHEYILITDGELYHHGIKGMKWGVRKDKQPTGQNNKSHQQKTTKKSMTTAQKVAIGSAVTAGILATAYASYTIGKAYRRESSEMLKGAASMAKGMATASKLEQELFNAPAFNQAKYNTYFKEFKSEGYKKILKTPVRKILAPEINKQRRFVRDISLSTQKRIAPSSFNMFGPEPFQKILERYNN